MNGMNWLGVYPEIVLLVMACVVALADLFIDDPRRRVVHGLTQATLWVVAGLHLAYFSGGLAFPAMQGMVITDPLSHLLAAFAAAAVSITLLYGRAYAADRELWRGELFTLSLFSLLGISIMVAGNNFLVLYLGLELMSLSLYALVALRRDDAQSTEAAMKYFVLGALASGFLLYGLSMIYGATGSLDLNEVAEVLNKGGPNPQVLAFGTVFVVAGVAFKLGAVPFHMWLPDVYHGAPTVVTLLIAGAPKIAAFGMAVRLLVGGMVGLAPDWQQMLIVLAVGSLVVGNLAAIAQANLKRMLAYSTIGQVGFVLLGLASGVVHGNTVSAGPSYSAAMFYVVTYVLTTLGTFGLIMLLARRGFEAEAIDDLAGLNRRSPLVAGVMAVFMLSLAGVPPLVGFHAKLVVLQAMVSTYEAIYLWLAVFAVVMSLVGAFYYLRVIKVMYFDEPVQGTGTLESGRAGGMILSLNGALVLLLGLLPGGLLAICYQAISKSLAA